MFLIVHASVGALLGDRIHSPIAAAGAGFLSHFIVDLIPHGDEVIGRTLFRRDRRMLLVALAIIDGVAALSLVTVFWVGGLILNPVGALSGALGAILPDALHGVSVLSRGKFWPRFARLHESNHRLFGYEAPLLVGLSLQAVTIIIVLVFLTSSPIVGVMARS